MLESDRHQGVFETWRRRQTWISGTAGGLSRCIRTITDPRNLDKRLRHLIAQIGQMDSGLNRRLKKMEKRLASRLHQIETALSQLQFTEGALDRHPEDPSIPAQRSTFPCKENAIRRLIKQGLQINTVIDVGVHQDTPELRLGLPDKRHLLFEPVKSFHPSIITNYQGLNYLLVDAAVSNVDGDGWLEEKAIDGGSAITHASLSTSENHSSLKPVKIVRLDTFLSTRKEPGPYLLKIDVDGLEIAVLDSSDGIWNDISCIIIEATRETIVERLNFISQRGFTLFDIVDQCYYYDVFSQVDLIFISNETMKKPDFRPWETQPFSWSKWQRVTYMKTH